MEERRGKRESERYKAKDEIGRELKVEKNMTDKRREKQEGRIDFLIYMFDKRIEKIRDWMCVISIGEYK